MSKKDIAIGLARKGKPTRRQVSVDDLEVEKQEHGYMVIGTNSILMAKDALKAEIEDSGAYRFAKVTFYKDVSAVWLSTESGALWQGSYDNDR